MSFFRLPLCIVALAAATGCGGDSASVPDLATRAVTLPDGARILAEVKATPEQMQQGMMFRDSLAADRGMLFVHGTAGKYAYWMYHCRIPLDIIWMDSGHRVVEISADTPACKTEAPECPSYGGHETAQFALELGGGEARRHGVEIGGTLAF